MRCPFCEYDLSGIPGDFACPECGMDPGDRDDACRRPDRDLKVLSIVYAVLWMPIFLAVPLSIATLAVAHKVYGVDMYQASQPDQGPYLWIDVLWFFAGGCVLYCVLFWFATWMMGPIIVGLRIRSEIKGIKTPEAFWLLVFGPLIACPIAYVGSMLFLSGH